MTIRTEILGGSDWENGQYLTGPDLVDTFDKTKYDRDIILKLSSLNFLNHKIAGTADIEEDNFIWRTSAVEVDGYTQLDDFTNSSVDARWVIEADASGGTATSVEDSSKWRLRVIADSSVSGEYCSIYGKDTGTGSYNFDGSNQYMIRLLVSVSLQSANPSPDPSDAYIQLTDGTNTVTIHTYSSPASAGATLSFSDREHFLYINQSAETASLYNVDTGLSTDVNISSLNAYNLRFGVRSRENGSGPGNGLIDIKVIEYIEAGISTAYWTSSHSITSTDTLTRGILWYDVNDTDLLTGTQLSANNGSNWSNATKNTLGFITTTGTQPEVRFQYTAPSTLTFGDHNANLLTINRYVGNFDED